jgi:hypothetical protein
LIIRRQKKNMGERQNWEWRCTGIYEYVSENQTEDIIGKEKKWIYDHYNINLFDVKVKEEIIFNELLRKQLLIIWIFLPEDGRYV